MKKQVFKETNQFALLAMITDTKIAHLGLSVNERALLTALINFRNAKIYNESGRFEAWPSIDTLTEYAGLKERTIHTCKASLANKNFIKIRSGKGQGNNNHYLINARKIVECYNTQREHKATLPDNLHYDEESITTPMQERNTSGLKKGSKAGTNQKSSGLTTKTCNRSQNDCNDFAAQLDCEVQEVSELDNGFNEFFIDLVRGESNRNSIRNPENCVYFESGYTDDDDENVPF